MSSELLGETIEVDTCICAQYLFVDVDFEAWLAREPSHIDGHGCRPRPRQLPSASSHRQHLLAHGGSLSKPLRYENLR